jgi:hypothetical protein
VPGLLDGDPRTASCSGGRSRTSRLWCSAEAATHLWTAGRGRLCLVRRTFDRAGCCVEYAGDACRADRVKRSVGEYRRAVWKVGHAQTSHPVGATPDESRSIGLVGSQDHFSARWSAWIRRIVFERLRSTIESV